MQAYSSCGFIFLLESVICSSCIPPPPCPFLVKYLCRFCPWSLNALCFFFFFFSEKSIQSNNSALSRFLFSLGSGHQSWKSVLLRARPSALDQVKVFGEFWRWIGSDLKCHQVESFCSKIKYRLGSESWKPEMLFNHWDSSPPRRFIMIYLCCEAVSITVTDTLLQPDFNKH